MERPKKKEEEQFESVQTHISIPLSKQAKQHTTNKQQPKKKKNEHTNEQTNKQTSKQASKQDSINMVTDKQSTDRRSDRGT